ncbi:MAG: CHAT domain-containing protein [Nitrospirae bacterium]|nr:CHAT domain-containing protein [Nitrospirota bacterium]
MFIRTAYFFISFIVFGCLSPFMLVAAQGDGDKIMDRPIFLEGHESPKIEIMQGRIISDNPDELRQLRDRAKDTHMLQARLNSEDDSIIKVFEKAEWELYEDGRFSFNSPQADIAINGMFKVSVAETQRGRLFVFHGDNTRKRSTSDVSSLDGVIRKAGDGYILDALYTYYSTAMTVVRISQSLYPTAKAVSETKRGKDRPTQDVSPKATDDSDNNVMSDEVIEGVKVFSTFDIMLEGKTDNVAFKDIKGVIFISRSMQGDTNPFSVHLSTPDIASSNGYIGWSSETSVLSNNTYKANCKIDVKDGRVTLKVGDEVGLTDISWWASDDTMVNYEKDEVLSFSVQGDDISGGIHASGLGGMDRKRKSVYDATFTGKIQGSEAISKAKQTISTSSKYDGDWVTGKDEFGSLSLRQEGNKVRGTYTARGGGSIDGSVVRGSVDFTWKDTKSEGWGIIRDVFGVKKIAILWESRQEGHGGIRHLIAKDKSSLASSDQDTFNSENDVMPMKYFAQKIASEGKCDEAVPLLEKVQSAYKKEVDKENKDKESRKFMSESFNLISVNRALNDCYFKQGNYKRLIETLSDDLESYSNLRSDEKIKRYFRILKQDTIKQLTHHLDLINIYQNGFNSMEANSEYVGIGMFIGQDDKTKEVVIDSIMKDTPAFMAGMLVDDVIKAIDGHPVEGLQKEEVLKMLKGPIDAPVSVTVKRVDKTLDFSCRRIVIKLMKQLSESRKVEIRADIQSISESLETLRAAINDTIKTLREQEAKINEGGRAALDIKPITDSLNALTAKIEIEKLRTLDLFKTTYAQQQTLLKMFLSIYNEMDAMNSKPDNMEDVKLAKYLDNLEEKIDLYLRKDQGLSQFEKGFFKSHIYLLGSTLPEMQFYSKNRVGHLTDMLNPDRFPEDSKEFQKNLEGVSSYIENWRNRLVLDEDKIDAVDKAQEFFIKLVNLLIKLDKKDYALVYSEMARARAFVDLLASKPGIQKEVKALIEKTHSAIPNPTTTTRLNIAEIKEIVSKRKSTTIEYFFTENDLVIWVISPSGDIKTVVTPIGSLHNDVKRFTDLTKDRDKENYKDTAEMDREIGNVLKDLYNALIQPIPKEILPTKDEVLTIIPYGDLFSVPFAALRDSNGRYLIEQHPIVYATSIAELKYTHDNKKRIVNPQRPNLLALVNPQPMPVSYGKEKALERTEQGFGSISQFYKDGQANMIVTRERATKAVLESEASKYSVLYLATHGTLNDKEPLESFVELAKNNKDDGLLKVLDIYKLDLHTDVVILAACVTASGGISGDGINGFSRAFTWAGTPTLLANLWNVPQGDTLHLMYRFHDYWINQGLSKAAALAMAQLDYINEYPDTSYIWSGLIMYGEWE